MTQSRFNLDMLAMARDLKEMTQEQLATKAGLSQGFISQVQAGEKDVSDDAARRIAESLELPLSFFYQDEEYTGFGISGISMVYYRKRSKTLKSHLKRLQAEVNARRIHAKRLLRDVNIKTKYTFEFMDIDEHGGKPEDVAIRLRATWMLPMGPVKNLVSTIESAGGIVFKFPFGTTDIDAMSQWPDDCPPLFFVNASAPADRARFSLAHELGHVVMHKTATEYMEGEADRFASEFLMPSSDIGGELINIDLARAAALKPYWRVSMAALIYRAKSLNKITETKYRDMFIELGKLGYRQKEPNSIPAEEPTIMNKVMDILLNHDQVTMDQIALRLDYPKRDVSLMYVPVASLRLAQ
ncbi:MAG: ImmA/IrrE family metallo-endopeptidase [Phycisphaeraceae bacterium]|nr:ImmA/IrrE family metallo-endopeptidase [Phycisphaeraceae bacterium]